MKFRGRVAERGLAERRLRWVLRLWHLKNTHTFLPQCKKSKCLNVFKEALASCQSLMKWEKRGWQKTLVYYFVRFCEVLKIFVIFCNFWRTDRPTDRQTDLGIKAPSRSLKMKAEKRLCNLLYPHPLTSNGFINVKYFWQSAPISGLFCFSACPSDCCS